MTELEKPLSKSEHAQLLIDIESSVGQEERFAELESKVQRNDFGRIIYSKEEKNTADDSALWVSFSTEKRLNKLKSFQAKARIYDEMDFVTIIIPGRDDLTFHGPVTPYYEWRFGQEYKTFKLGEKSAPGTWLTALGSVVTEDDVKALNAVGIYTVEQAARMPDDTLGGGFHPVRLAAQRYVATQKSPDQKALDDKLAKQNETIAQLKNQLEEATAVLQKMANIKGVKATTAKDSE